MTTAPARDAPARRAARAPGASRRVPGPGVLGLIGIGGFLLLLEVLPLTPLVDARFLPPLHEMLAALVDSAGTSELWTALGATLRGWATGLVIAVVAGVVLGIVIGSVPVLRAATSSTIEFLRPIPSVALIPLVVIVFGITPTSTILLVVYASFWQVLLQVLYGVQDVDPVARETARSYRFRPLTQVRTVVWPTALPYVVTGVRLAASVALVLEITGELIIGSPGLGRLIGIAQSSGAVDTLYALVIVTGLIGVLVNLAARALERRVLRWHPSIRREAAA